MSSAEAHRPTAYTFQASHLNVFLHTTKFFRTNAYLGRKVK